MKRTSGKLLCIALSIVLSVAAVPSDTQAAAKTVVVKMAKTKTITVGVTSKLKLTGNKDKVKWTTSNDEIVEIVGKAKSYARLKGVEPGKATVTAKIGKTSYKCKVTVKKATVATGSGNSKNSTSQSSTNQSVSSGSSAPSVATTPTKSETTTVNQSESEQNGSEETAGYTPTYTEQNTDDVSYNSGTNWQQSWTEAESIEQNTEANQPERTYQPETQTYEPEQAESMGESSQTWVLNTSTMKFHYPTCSDVPRIKEENKSYMSGTYSDAVSSGYSPCGHCNPHP